MVSEYGLPYIGLKIRELGQNDTPLGKRAILLTERPAVSLKDCYSLCEGCYWSATHPRPHQGVYDLCYFISSHGSAIENRDS